MYSNVQTVFFSFFFFIDFEVTRFAFDERRHFKSFRENRDVYQICQTRINILTDLVSSTRTVSYGAIKLKISCKPRLLSPLTFVKSGKVALVFWESYWQFRIRRFLIRFLNSMKEI